MNARTFSFLRITPLILLIVAFATSVFQPQLNVSAAATLSITPNSWNVIGLDSNNPAVGPYRFPVGAKVCSSVATTNVVVNFVWDDSTNASDIYLRVGSLPSITIPSIAAGAANCKDAYFEVEVNRATAPYDETRKYHITATDSSGTVSTIQPRELYVEHLISQNRNSITDVKLNGVSIAAGGTMTLLVGNTYTIELDGGTATQGYNQFEDFINFPNTIFQMLSVSTTYSADSNTSHVPNPNPALYADACTWDNDPNSPTYRSCIGGDDKAGGSNVVTTYTVKILSGAGTTQTLNTLLYDFSGSSYHYNADYGVGARYAYIVGPSSVMMLKSFSPKAIAPGGTSAMTIKLSNPTSVNFTGVHFTDAFPASMTIANTTTTNTCGGSLTDNTSGALGVGDVGIALSGGALSANSTCTITVNITVPAGTYVNTTGNLFVDIGGTDTDTGNNASDTLTASSAPACTPGQTIAQWTVPSTATNPPDATGGTPTTTGGNVGSATASFSSSNGGGSVIDTSGGQNDLGSWKIWGWKTAGSQILFKVDTSGYSGNSSSFYAYHDSAGPTSITVEYSTNSGSTYSGTTTSALNATFTQYSLSIPQNNTVWVKITATGANNDNSGADLFVDNITFTGCAVPIPAPTISKTFRNAAGIADVTSIQKSATSTLRFTISNTVIGNKALTGVAFTDTLPLGLEVLSFTSTQCGGTLTVTNNASPTRDTISLSGGTLAAGGSCPFDVTVTGTTAGQYDNVTSYISSTQSGTSTNYAEDTLDVIAPPVLAKSFNLSSISTGNISTLAFTITNPNNFTSLSGIGFTDMLPSGVTAPDGTTNNVCGSGSSLVISGGNLLTVTGGSLASNVSCNFSVTVTGTTSGTKNNTTSLVTSTEGGNGNTASATLVVSDLMPLIGLNKQISTDNTNWSKFVGVIPTQNIWYRFTVSNDGEVTLNGINLTDTIYTSSLASCTPSLPTSLAVGASASCVLGPISVTAAPTPNPFVNTATVTTTTYTPAIPVTSTAKYGTESLTLVKNVTVSSFAVESDLLHYSYTVTNNGGYPLLGPVTVSDNKATVTCPAVSTVGDNDDYLDPDENLTCTATYSVAAGDVTAGFVTNSASATVGGITSNTDSKTVYRIPDFAALKTNDVSGSVGQGGTFHWKITVSNISTGPGTFADTQTILSDILPGAATYGVPVVTNGGTVPTGTISCSITGTALSCVASGAVAFPASASFDVTFPVTPTATGSLVNTTTVDPNGSITELDETNNSSTDTVTVLGAPSISKSFSPNPTVANANSTLTFTITNPNMGTDLNGVAFSDTYPTGLVNATPLATTNTCGGTLTAAAGGGSISLSGGIIAINNTCTITVSVVAATGGNYTNITGTVSSTNGGTGNTASSTLIVFDARPSKSVVTTSEPSTTGVSGTDRVTIGEMIHYRLVSRIPEGSFTNVQLLDRIPNGLQFLNDNTAKVAFVCNSGAACMTSSTLSGPGLVVNGASSNVSPAFLLPGSAISGGPFLSDTDVTFSLGNITNSDADADSEYVVVEFNALVLNVNMTTSTLTTVNQGTNNQTGADISNFRSNDVTLRVNGSTLGNTSPNANVDIAEPAITSLTKSISPASGPYLPGDAVTYTMSFSNVPASNNNAATAFDVALSDTFNSNLTLGAVNVSSTQGATCAGGTVFSTSNSTVGQLVTVNISCLDPGKTVTVTVNATIAGATTSGTTIANSSSLTYTSLPGTQGNCATTPFTCTGIGTSGSGTGERNGSGGSGADNTVLNNYATTSNTVNTTVSYGSITITKNAVPDNAQDFAFTGSGPSSYNFGGGFSLDDDTDATLPNTQTFTPLAPGAYSVTEASVSRWSLTGLTCVDPDSGSSTDLGTATATIDLDADESISCTYTNTQWAPSIVLTKTPILNDTVVAPSGVVNVGDTITYAFSAQNTGNVIVTNITVTDPLLPTLSCTIASLAPGATASCTATNNAYTLTQADIDNGTRDNTATATGKDPDNLDVTDSDTKTLTLTQSASIILTKTPALNDAIVAPGGVVNPDDTITYTFSMQNTGNVTITNIVVTDPLLPTLTCTIASLAPGASSSCTVANNTYVLTQADIDAGSRANTAFATGKDPGNNNVTDPDTKTVTLTQGPGLLLTKTANPTSVSNVGDIVTYTFSVQNTGNVTLTNIALSDTLLSGLSCTSIVTLLPGASQAFTCTENTYTITQQDIDNNGGGDGDIDNTATATGTLPGGGTISDDDSQAVTLPQPNPDLTIDKVLTGNADEDGSGTVSLNDTLTYTVTVTNTGNTTLTNVVVSDLLLSTSPKTCATLAPQATCVLTGDYAVTQADVDAGQINNTGSVTDNDVCSPTSCDDPNTVPVPQNPALTTAKSETSTGPYSVGDTIAYDIAVTNTGNVTLTGVSVTHPTTTVGVCIPAQPASLAPNATMTCPASHAVTQTDIDNGSYANTATGDSDQTPSSDSTVTINFTPNPDISIVKSSDATGTNSVGDSITYTYDVQNTGNVTLTNVTAADAHVGLSAISCTPAQGSTLTPSVTMQCTATYTVLQSDVDAGHIDNIGVATGTPPTGPDVTESDPLSVSLPQNAGLTIAKSQTSTGPYAVGGSISYSVVVTNTGSVTLTNVIVSDADLTPNSNTCASLAPGSTCVLNGTYTVQQADVNVGSFTNTASVTDDAVCPAAGAGTCEDSFIVTFQQNPAIHVVKSSTTTSITADGQVVPYSFTVTNTGNVSLTGVTVSDSMCDAAPALQSGDNGDLQLETTETWIYTCNHTVTQLEVNAGGNLSNTVTADSTESTPDTDTLNIPVGQNHALTITKSATSAGPYSLGDTITYDVVMENTGNVTLTNVVVSDPKLTPSTANCASVTPGNLCTLTGTHTVTQADIDAGSINNTGSVTDDNVCPAAGPTVCEDTVTVTFPKNPGLSIVKEVSNSSSGPWNDTSVTVTVGDTVYYRVRVANTGNTTLTGLTVDDGMASCTLARGTDMTGNNDNTFEIGEEWAYTCSVTAIAGTNNNTATADSNETSQSSDTASYIAGAASVADPALSKAASPSQASVGETVTFTLAVTNQGTAPAPNVVVTDALPSIFDVTAVNVSGAPLGTLVNVTPVIGTGPAPYTVVVTLGADLAASDLVTIQIVTKVNSLGNPPINNTASLTTSALTDVVANDADSISINVRNSVRRLPATGFAKGLKTVLGTQPLDLKYAATDVMLEIPSLGVKIPIVGVPQKNGTWNVSWLENQAGWLQGSAFPSWSGNSVLTGHVYLASGLPGPFVDLSKLKYGDKIIVYAYGQKYTFAVQTNTIVNPSDQSAMKHEEKSWVTLVTCKDYDEKTKTYLSRVVVRAVLVKVDWE